ncbi:TylF/MycF/NovP-related O-methyltransferase [Spirosoma pollinicola]|uniref:Methyltransferase n=1 Tax=Spirosoma pollinicola TaxID=2057025 RepID=A0A2K8YZF6_9BACT|nr:TylF/MycF/NovP-related O-methyltransferase [Spirosoma pollinicola]AUD03012.1 methyltransferase [Spirosoma pollinicola]
MLRRSIINIAQNLLATTGYTFATRMTWMERKPRFLISDRMDYVRLSSLDLCASEIYDKQIAGNVAELGVFRGDFAEKISLAFPDRKLYLFDTFEGFDKRDIAVDNLKSYSAGDEDFSKTSVNIVLKNLPYPQNCLIRKGFFPESVQPEDTHETFAFVSIDTDLYQPIFEGLEFFYPRLSRGGYIFIHDYNNDVYKGAKQAVQEFCQKNSVSYFPLTDGAGSAIIAK